MNGKILTNEQKRKYDFTRKTLANFLRETLENPHYCAAYYVDEDGREWVDITFENEYSICKADVTEDNLKALVMDVLRRI